MVTYVDPHGKISEIDFKDILSQATYTVLYFYPKDNTPGCAIEAKDFSALQKDFKKLNAQVIGVSKDSTKSHRSFQTKQELSLGLIADPETTFIQKF
ncbi:MAG: peroxiredoxin [bacterium]